MLLKSLELSNFRGFENISISFNDNLTVVVGKNGSGKSTVLEAAAIAVGTFTAAMDGLQNYGIKKDDAHLRYYKLGSNIDVQPQFPVSVKAEGIVDGKEVSWERMLKTEASRGTMATSKEITDISQEYQRRFRSGDKTLILPVVAYYGTGRLWVQYREKKDDKASKNTRTNGYIDNLNGAANNKLMLKWFRKMAVQEHQRNGAIPEFRAVCDAVSRCFGAITGYEKVSVQYNLDTDEIDVIYADEKNEWVRIPVNKLSDGYKCTLSLIADIAYRMAQLNPQLFDKVLSETNGVVLIDEIDLHLHPEWQSRILSDLVSIFPKVQFIVSTHAPSVINSIKSENLVILDDNNARNPAGEIYGKDTNTIISGVMGSKERPDIVMDLFGRFYTALSKNDFEESEIIIERLESMLGYDDSEIASLHTKLKLARIKKRKK